MKCVYLGGLAGIDRLVDFIGEQKNSILIYESRDAGFKTESFKLLQKNRTVFVSMTRVTFPKIQTHIQENL